MLCRFKRLFVIAATTIGVVSLSSCNSSDNTKTEYLKYYNTIEKTSVATVKVSEPLADLSKYYNINEGYEFRGAFYENGVSYNYRTVEEDIKSLTPFPIGLSIYYNVNLEYKPINYQITYKDVNGYDTSSWPTTFNVLSRSSISLPQITKEHYTLVGWRTSYDSVITSLNGAKLENLELTPEWSTNSYKITFSYDKAAVSKNPNQSAYTYLDGIVNLEPLKMNDGYRFVAWKDENGQVVESFDSKIEKDLLLTAEIETITYTAYFYDGNDKLIDQKEYNILNYTSLEYPAIPPRDHYEGKWEGALNTKGDSTFKIKYTPCKYNIEFRNTMGATPSTGTVKLPAEYLTNIKLGNPINVPNGYSFAGYKYGDEYIEKAFDLETNMTIDMIWDKIQYTISFDTSVLDDKVLNNIIYDIESETFELPILEDTDNYAFGGWMIKGDSQGQLISRIEKGSTGDMELEPVLDGKTKTIRYQAPEKDVETIYVKYGEKLTLPEPEVIEHKHFVEYRVVDTDEVFSTSNVIEQYKGGSVDIYPYYENNTYKVTVVSSNPLYNNKEYEVTYPGLYQEIYDVFENTETKSLKGLYKDSEHQELIDKNDKVLSDITVYDKWIANVSINSYDGLLTIADDVEGIYKITNDINCLGKPLPHLDNFDGVIDGGDHKIYNFTYNEAEVDINHAIITNNNGVIKNLSFEDFGGAIGCRVRGKNERNIALLVAVNNGTMENIHIKGMTLSFALTNGYYYNSYAIDYRTDGETYNTGVLCANNKGNIKDVSISNSTLNINNENQTCFNYVSNSETVYRNVGILVGLNQGVIQGVHSTNNIMNTSFLGVDKFNIVSSYTKYGLFGVCEKGELSEVSITDTTINVQNITKIITNVTVGLGVGRIGTGATVHHIGVERGQINVIESASGQIGGLIGSIDHDGVLNDAYSKDVEIYNKSPKKTIGGLVGINKGSISTSYAMSIIGNANESSTSGGLVGTNENTGVIYKSISCTDIVSNYNKIAHFSETNKGAVSMSYYAVNARLDYISTPFDKDESSYAEPVQLSDVYNNDLFRALYWDMEGWVISICDFPLLEFEFDASEYKEKVIEPSCDMAGCTICYLSEDMYFIKNSTPSLGHQYEVIKVVDPTCEEDGYTLERCSRCEDEIHTHIVDKLGHTVLKDSDSTIPATCEHDGLYTYECATCHEHVEEVIEAHGHHDSGVVIIIKEHTCEEKGLAKHTCTNLDCDCEGGVYYVDIPAHDDADHDLVCDTCGLFIGNGVQLSKFTPINTVEDFKSIALDMNGNYILNKDLDFANELFTPIGDESHPFTGVLYGNNKTIKNININDDNVKDKMALFYKNAGIITSLNVGNISIRLSDKSLEFGAIAYKNTGTISKCNITDDIKVVLFETQYISELNATFSMKVKVGGIVLSNESRGKVSYCEMRGSSSISIDHVLFAGKKYSVSGIVQWLRKGKIRSNILFHYSPLVCDNLGIMQGCVNKGSIDVAIATQEFLYRFMGDLAITTETSIAGLASTNSGQIIDSKTKAINYNVEFNMPDLTWLVSQFTDLYRSSHKIQCYFSDYRDIVAMNKDRAIVSNCVVY